MLSTYFDALRRVLTAPAIWLGALLATLVVGAPLIVVLHGMLAPYLGPAQAADRALDTVNCAWWHEFRHQTSSVGPAVGPSLLGVAPSLQHESGFAGRAESLAGAAIGTWLVAWSFLSGGILDRLARNRPVGAGGFFAACGTHCFPLIRLGIGAVLAYWIILGPVHGQLMASSQSFPTALALYAFFGLLVAVTSVLVDYASIRIVVEDRRSALGAIAASVRFIRRSVRRVGALAAANLVLFLAAVALYAMIAPEARAGASMMWIGTAISLAWIAIRVGLKLLTYATGVSLFQDELAYAGFVMTAMPARPDVPTTDALRAETPRATAP